MFSQSVGPWQRKLRARKRIRQRHYLRTRCGRTTKRRGHQGEPRHQDAAKAGRGHENPPILIGQLREPIRSCCRSGRSRTGVHSNVLAIARRSCLRAECPGALPLQTTPYRASVVCSGWISRNVPVCAILVNTELARSHAGFLVRCIAQRDEVSECSLHPRRNPVELNLAFRHSERRCGLSWCLYSRSGLSDRQRQSSYKLLNASSVH